MYIGLSVVAMTCAMTCLSILYEKHVDKTRAIDSSSTPPVGAYGKNKKNTNENRLQVSENKASPQQPLIISIKISETSPMSLSPLPLATISPGKPNFSGQQKQKKPVTQADDTKTVDGITIYKVELISKPASAPINKKKNSASVSSAVTSVEMSRSTAAKNNHYPRSTLNFIQEDIVTQTLTSEEKKGSVVVNQKSEPSTSKQQCNSGQTNGADDDKENNPPLATAVTHHYHQPSKPGHFSFTFLIGTAVFVSSHLTYHSKYKN